MVGNGYNQTGQGVGVATKTIADLHATCSFLENVITPVTAYGITAQPFMNTNYRNMVECSAFYNLKILDLNNVGAPYGNGNVLTISPSVVCWETVTVCLMDTECAASFNKHVAKGNTKGIPMTPAAFNTRYGMMRPAFAALTKDQVCDFIEIAQEDFKKGKYNNKEQAALNCYAQEHNYDIPYCMDKVKDKIKKIVVMIGALAGAGGLVVGLLSFGAGYFMCCRNSKVTP